MGITRIDTAAPPDHFIHDVSGSRNRANLVIRQVCNRHGDVLDYLTEGYDGSQRDMIAAAKRLSERMFVLYDDVSNIASRIVATDEQGNARWTISQNFQIVIEC